MASLFNPFAWYPATTTYTQAPMPSYMYNYSAPASDPSYVYKPVGPSAEYAKVLADMANMTKNQGLNPGLMQAVPIYNGNDPTVNRYSWGPTPYQPGPTFDANLARGTNAPAAKAPVATASKASPFAAVTTTVPKAAPKAVVPAPKAVQPAPTAKR